MPIFVLFVSAGALFDRAFSLQVSLTILDHALAYSLSAIFEKVAVVLSSA